MHPQAIFYVLAAAAVPLVSAQTGVFPNATTTIVEVVTAFETFCPGPTTLTYNAKTYVVVEPTTLTITDCPCTRVKTVALADCSTAPTGGLVVVHTPPPAVVVPVPVPPPSGTPTPKTMPVVVVSGAVPRGAVGQSLFGLIVAVGAGAVAAGAFAL